MEYDAIKMVVPKIAHAAKREAESPLYGGLG
jgi:hypothetical protein